MNNDLLKNAKSHMNGSSKVIETCSVATADGLGIESDPPLEDQGDRIASMSTALLSIGEKTAMLHRIGHASEVIVIGEDGVMVASRAAPELVLTAQTHQEVSIDTLAHDIHEAAVSLAATNTSTLDATQEG